MKGDIIPDGHHVARYCKGPHVEDGWPTAGAFNIRPDDESSLSVNWMEFFNNRQVVTTKEERKTAVEEIREMIQMDPTYTGRFAVLNVGLLKLAISTAGGYSPSVVEDPQGKKPADGKRPERPPDPSHALIYGYQADDLKVASELLALLGPNDVFEGKVQ